MAAATTMEFEKPIAELERQIDELRKLAGDRQLSVNDTIAPLEPLPARVIPLKDRQEFVCNRCRLVKARVQLADSERGLCRDCV